MLPTKNSTKQFIFYKISLQKTNQINYNFVRDSLAAIKFCKYD